MSENVIEWLLAGPAWIRYAVEKEIFNEKPNIKQAINDLQILEIINRLRDSRKGIPNIGLGYWDSDEYLNPYWDLYFLSDLGFEAEELGLHKLIEGFLATQAREGYFITEPGMKPRYFCKSAIILSSISFMSFRDSPEVQKYVQLVLSSQRLDGGWYCNPDHDIGNDLQYEYSCPQDNLNILRLLGQYPEFREDNRFNGAIDLLLRHWELRDTGIRIVYFGTGHRYRSLHYPATR
ncbi:MAG: hypothetical protein NUV31_06685, partial [Dehalococcoidales bacterium]|nr:hypothetical protein [Dehalococcoidales bacterium]